MLDSIAVVDNGGAAAPPPAPFVCPYAPKRSAWRFVLGVFLDVFVMLLIALIAADSLRADAFADSFGNPWPDDIFFSEMLPLPNGGGSGVEISTTSRAMVYASGVGYVLIVPQRGYNLAAFTTASSAGGNVAVPRQGSYDDSPSTFRLALNGSASHFYFRSQPDGGMIVAYTYNPQTRTYTLLNVGPNCPIPTVSGGGSLRVVPFVFSYNYWPFVGQMAPDGTAISFLPIIDPIPDLDFYETFTTPSDFIWVRPFDALYSQLSFSPPYKYVDYSYHTLFVGASDSFAVTDIMVISDTPITYASPGGPPILSGKTQIYLGLPVSDGSVQWVKGGSSAITQTQIESILAGLTVTVAGSITISGWHPDGTRVSGPHGTWSIFADYDDGQHEYRAYELDSYWNYVSVATKWLHGSGGAFQGLTYDELVGYFDGQTNDRQQQMLEIVEQVEGVDMPVDEQVGEVVDAVNDAMTGDTLTPEQAAAFSPIFTGIFSTFAPILSIAIGGMLVLLLFKKGME